MLVPHNPKKKNVFKWTFAKWHYWGLVIFLTLAVPTDYLSDPFPLLILFTDVLASLIFVFIPYSIAYWIKKQKTKREHL